MRTADVASFDYVICTSSSTEVVIEVVVVVLVLIVVVVIIVVVVVVVLKALASYFAVASKLMKRFLVPAAAEANSVSQPAFESIHKKQRGPDDDLIVPVPTGVAQPASTVSFDPADNRADAITRVQQCYSCPTVAFLSSAERH